MSHHNDKYMKRVTPVAREVKNIDSPVFFKSWAPEIIPDPDETEAWRDIFEECDGIAMSEEFKLKDGETGEPQIGMMIFMKETTEDDPEINFTVNEAFAEHFRARRNIVLERANASL